MSQTSRKIEEFWRCPRPKGSRPFALILGSSFLIITQKACWNCRYCDVFSSALLRDVLVLLKPLLSFRAYDYSMDSLPKRGRPFKFPKLDRNATGEAKTAHARQQPTHSSHAVYCQSDDEVSDCRGKEKPSKLPKLDRNLIMCPCR